MPNIRERQDQPNSSVTHRRGDEARFFRGWLRRPLIMGAVSPSSRSLGNAMASFVPDPPRIATNDCVVELGPGTGVVTQCLIDRGVPEEALVLVEYSAEFCVLLRSRFPRAKIIQGDAYSPDVFANKAVAGRAIHAVVSSLPLFTKPEGKREQVLSDALARMKADAPFIQFSYALTFPVKPQRVGARIHTSSWIKRNLPPARVLVYQREESHS